METDFPPIFQKKTGRPKKVLTRENLEKDHNTFNSRTAKLHKDQMEFLDKPENSGIDLFTFHARMAIREGLNPNSRHYSHKKSHLFRKVANEELVYEPVNAREGLSLMSFTNLGEKKMKKVIKFFGKRGFKIATMDNIRAEKKRRVPKHTVTPTGGKKNL